MTIKKIKYKIKTNKTLSFLFLMIMSLLFRVLSLIIKRKKKILFSSFSGRQYSDSPRAIYDNLRSDSKFREYEMKWAFVDPDSFPQIPNKNKVNIDSFRYYLELFSSSIWIANASIERLIPFKPHDVVYINTWHGIPLKHLGPDEHETTYIVRNWYAKVNFDLLTVSGEYDKNVFSRIFPSTKNIQITGLPRNQSLYAVTEEKANQIKESVILKYHLDKNKPIILYAPTFREYRLDSDDYAFQGNFLEVLSKKYNLLFRGHYYAEDKNLKKIFTNVSNEQDLDSLLIASDLLISDYSSIVFDYSILKKPMILYCYDLDDYLEHRGVYIDPRKLGLPVVETEEELVKTIMNNYNSDKIDIFYSDFYNKFNGSFDRNLTVIKNMILFGK